MSGTMEQINAESKRTRDLLSLRRALEVYEVTMNQFGASHHGLRSDIFHQGLRDEIAKLAAPPEYGTPCNPCKPLPRLRDHFPYRRENA